MIATELGHASRPTERWALAFQKGDEVVAGIEAFAREHGIETAHFTAIGAFRAATLAYFDWDTRKYHEIPVDEQVEVASLVGNVAIADGEPTVHIHCVLSRGDGTAVAGHLMEARVRPTLELFLDVHGERLVKEADAESGLSLLAPNQPAGR